MRIPATGRLLPGDRAPHVAVALGDANVGDAVGYFPVTGGVGGQRGGNTCGQNESGNNYAMRDSSWRDSS